MCICVLMIKILTLPILIAEAFAEAPSFQCRMTRWEYENTYETWEQSRSANLTFPCRNIIAAIPHVNHALL